MNIFNVLRAGTSLDQIVNWERAHRHRVQAEIVDLSISDGAELVINTELEGARRLSVLVRGALLCDVTYQPRPSTGKVRVVIYDYRAADVTMDIAKPAHEALSLLARHLNQRVSELVGVAETV